MAETIEELLDLTDYIIFSRGEEYYESEQIEYLLKSQNVYKAHVSGRYQNYYNIFVETDEEENVINYGCDCPYYADICKHLVAVFLAIQDENFEDGNFEQEELYKSKDPVNLHTLIDELPQDELKKFILSYAENNTIFKKELLLAFGKPQFEIDLADTKNRLKVAIREGTHRGYIDYDGSYYICEECKQLLLIADKRLEQGHYKLSFLMAIHILINCVEIASISDTSEGELEWIMDYSLMAIDNSCKKAKELLDSKEQNLILETIIAESQSNVFDDWQYWKEKLLEFAIYFVTDENVKKIFSMLENLETTDNESSTSWAYFAKMMRLDIYRELGDEKSADKYLLDNLELDKFREIAISKALEKGDFAYAEQLCLEKVDTSPKVYVPFENRSKWIYLLYEVYEISKNQSKKLEMAEVILLRNDLHYFDVLKTEFIKLNRWDTEYPILREKCAEYLTNGSYMDILKKENDLDLLMVQLKLHKKKVFTYGKILAEKYPKEVYDIFQNEILAQASEANKRRKYADVCSAIMTLFEANGIEEAHQLISKLKSTFSRHPAMLDELKKLQRYIKSKSDGLILKK